MSRRGFIVLGLAALCFFGYAWSVQAGRPTFAAVVPRVDRVIDPPPAGVSPGAAYVAQLKRIGWYAGAADQLNYAREARALARGELPGTQYDYKRDAPKPSYKPSSELSSYAYPLGYPSLGALSILAGVRGDPFLIPDALLFVAIVLLAFRIASRFLRAPWNWVYIVLLVLATPLTRYVSVPWNTTPTILAVLAALWVTAEGTDSWWNAALVAATAALCLSSRIVDVTWPLAILVVWCLLTRRFLRRVLVLTAVGLVLTGGLMMWTQHRVFGDAFTTPYAAHNGGAGIGLAEFDITRIPKDAWDILVTGQTAGGDRTPVSGVDPNPLLREWPWLIVAPFGLVVAFRRRRDMRPWLVSGAGVSLAASFYYFAYTFATGDDLQFGVFRFFVAWFPLWALFAVMVIPAVLAPEAAAEPQPAVVPAIT